eukprot:600871-Alexandrium_andersonii.AAC.1
MGSAAPAAHHRPGHPSAASGHAPARSRGHLAARLPTHRAARVRRMSRAPLRGGARPLRRRCRAPGLRRLIPPPRTEAMIASAYIWCPVSYTHLTLPTICSV